MSAWTALRPGTDDAALFGVHILFGKWGQGYGTECMVAALDDVFERSDVERVLFLIHVENEPSNQMVTRYAMIEEGLVMHSKLPHIRVHHQSTLARACLALGGRSRR